ncbi:hypothetical protein KUC3_30010 [Alteromonas sp. KC3]|nr:hypothetical protein KUC3_30010 [Alteromonas sp. KC3]BCO24110.1 hypothetical protein KUC14_29790 [Alteromonas sp. KC14]
MSKTPVHQKNHLTSMYKLGPVYDTNINLAKRIKSYGEPRSAKCRNQFILGSFNEEVKPTQSLSHNCHLAHNVTI